MCDNIKIVIGSWGSYNECTAARHRNDRQRVYKPAILRFALAQFVKRNLFTPTLEQNIADNK